MKNKRLIFVLLLTLNIVLIGIIYNVIGKKPIIIKESKVIKEMTETEYDSQITELNKSHTEYATKVQENKKKIAQAITNAGVDTSKDDTADVMAINIEKILSEATKDATATAEDIVEGKTAYVDGNLITGSLSQTLLDFTSSSSEIVLNTSFYPTSKGTISRNFNATKGKLYLFVGVNRAGSWQFNFSSNFHVITYRPYGGLANEHYVAVGYSDTDSVVTVSATATTTDITSWFWASEITLN